MATRTPRPRRGKGPQTPEPAEKGVTMSRQSVARAHQKIQELAWEPKYHEPVSQYGTDYTFHKAAKKDPLKQVLRSYFPMQEEKDHRVYGAEDGAIRGNMFRQVQERWLEWQKLFLSIIPLPEISAARAMPLLFPVGDRAAQQRPGPRRRDLGQRDDRQEQLLPLQPALLHLAEHVAADGTVLRAVDAVVLLLLHREVRAQDLLERVLLLRLPEGVVGAVLHVWLVVL